MSPLAAPRRCCGSSPAGGCCSPLLPPLVNALTAVVARLPITALAPPISAGLIAPLNAVFQSLPCSFAARTATPPATTAPVIAAATGPPPGIILRIGPTLLIKLPRPAPTAAKINCCVSGFATPALTHCIKLCFVELSTPCRPCTAAPAFSSNPCTGPAFGSGNDFSKLAA